jgi:hypothetical protein
MIHAKLRASPPRTSSLPPLIQKPLPTATALRLPLLSATLGLSVTLPTLPVSPALGPALASFAAVSRLRTQRLVPLTATLEQAHSRPWPTRPSTRLRSLLTSLIVRWAHGRCCSQRVKSRGRAVCSPPRRYSRTLTPASSPAHPRFYPSGSSSGTSLAALPARRRWTSPTPPKWTSS